MFWLKFWGRNCLTPQIMRTKSAFFPKNKMNLRSTPYVFGLHSFLVINYYVDIQDNRTYIARHVPFEESSFPHSLVLLYLVHHHVKTNQFNPPWLVLPIHVFKFNGSYIHFLSQTDYYSNGYLYGENGLTVPMVGRPPEADTCCRWMDCKRRC